MLATTEGYNDAKLDITHAIDGFAGNEHYPAMFPLRNDIIELFARTGEAVMKNGRLYDGDTLDET